MKITISKKKLIYFILLAAYFNAVLRPSADSNITLYRVLLPISMIIILTISSNISLRLGLWMIGISCLTIVQYTLTRLLFFPYVSFNGVRLLEYLFHFLCILVLIGLMLSLKKLEGELFAKKIMQFFSTVTKIVILIYIIYLIFRNEPAKFLLFGNINDLGCVMTTGLAIIICNERKQKIKKILWIIIVFFILLYNDSKLALFGAILEVGLYYIIQFSYMNKNKFKLIIRRIFVILGISLIAVVFFVSPSINGYDLRDITIEPLIRIVRGEYYSDSSTSITFRTNCIIAIFNILKKSFALGVGVGNTGAIMKLLVPDAYGVFSKYSYLASHIWWLEVMSDLGIVFIITVVYLFIKQLRLFMQKSEMNFKEKLKLIVLLSFPLWSMSSSGLYTEYFSISIIIFALI